MKIELHRAIPKYFLHRNTSYSKKPVNTNSGFFEKLLYGSFIV